MMYKHNFMWFNGDIDCNRAQICIVADRTNFNIIYRCGIREKFETEEEAEKRILKTGCLIDNSLGKKIHIKDYTYMEG